MHVLFFSIQDLFSLMLLYPLSTQYCPFFEPGRPTQGVVKQHNSFLCCMVIIVYMPKWPDS